MSKKTCQVKLYKINGVVILARRDAKPADVQQWFKKLGERIESTAVVALTDKNPAGIEYTKLVEKFDFELDELPEIL